MTRRISLAFSLLLIGLLTAVAVSRVQVTNAQPPFLTGQWTAQFFNTTNFSGPVVATQSYSALNFNWPDVPLNAFNQPITGVTADNFSVRFTKGPVSITPGVYRYTLAANGAASLTVNNQTVITLDATGGTQSVDLNVPSAISLRVDFVNVTGPAVLQLAEPTSGGVPGQPPFLGTATPTITVVPSRTPLPPIPPGAITATVIRAGVLNVRDAPSLGGNRLGRILRGETYAIVGRDDDARWFLLQLGGYQGWAYGYYLFVNGNEFTPPIVSGNSVLGLAGQPDFGVRGQTHATLRLRAGPSVATMQTGRITWGAFLPIVGRTADGFWYQVVWKNTLGWAYAPFIDILEGDINNVPVR